MTINKQILGEFNKITHTDIISTIENANKFFTFSYNKIVDYYLGNVSVVAKGPFEQLTSLEVEIAQVFNTFEQFKNVLTNAKWWVLLSYIEDIDSRLKTTRHLNRWSKSSIQNTGYSTIAQVEYITKPSQTIERIVQDVLQDTDQDQWQQVLLNNHLKEENYSIEGGASLQLSFPQVADSVNITAVVDVMREKNIYGKDVNKKFHFNIDEQDLDVLSPDDTVYQTIDILSNLKQNDNPDYPYNGLQANIIGSNRASLNFPIINRQMAETFATDDSLKDFTILSIEPKGTALMIDYTVSTRLNLGIAQKVIV